MFSVNWSNCRQVLRSISLFHFGALYRERKQSFWGCRWFANSISCLLCSVCVSLSFLRMCFSNGEWFILTCSRTRVKTEAARMSVGLCCSSLLGTVQEKCVAIALNNITIAQTSNNAASLVLVSSLPFSRPHLHLKVVKVTAQTISYIREFGVEMKRLFRVSKIKFSLAPIQGVQDKV